MTAAFERSRPASSEEARDLARLVIAAAMRIRMGFDTTAARFDLSPPHVRALLALRTGTPMRALAGDLGCDASYITGIADRLEQRGLVRREAAADDRRVKLLVLTREGQKLRAQLEAAVVDGSPLMTGLSERERDTLRKLLVKALPDGAAEACQPY